MNGLGKSTEVRAGVRASGTGLPADIEKLRPSSNPSWETPRPVRKDGPGGKYHERKRPSKKNPDTQTLLKARMAKGKLNKVKTVEDLQPLLQNTSSHHPELPFLKIIGIHLRHPIIVRAF